LASFGFGGAAIDEGLDEVVLEQADAKMAKATNSTAVAQLRLTRLGIQQA
jgi:hypothetical protein